jgi:hypothetical protein
MTQSETKALLEAVADGKITPNDAMLKLKIQPFEELGFANVDCHRGLRQGIGEVIYGESKTAEQITEITRALFKNGQKSVLITRLSKEKADLIDVDLKYYEMGNIGIAGEIPSPDTDSTVLVVSAGTSDMNVAEEAAITAEFLGNKVERLYDVGVAGIHRLLAHSKSIMQAKVIIAVAGMEGALASVVGGLADCPVIAVPTSVGYGASFGGVTALLSMLNSCASGVTVVNIDNGFGAAYTASMINHIK